MRLGGHAHYSSIGHHMTPPSQLGSTNMLPKAMQLSGSGPFGIRRCQLYPRLCPDILSRRPAMEPPPFAQQQNAPTLGSKLIMRRAAVRETRNQRTEQTPARWLCSDFFSSLSLHPWWPQVLRLPPEHRTLRQRRQGPQIERPSHEAPEP